MGLHQNTKINFFSLGREIVYQCLLVNGLIDLHVVLVVRAESLAQVLYQIGLVVLPYNRVVFIVKQYYLLVVLLPPLYRHQNDG